MKQFQTYKEGRRPGHDDEECPDRWDLSDASHIIENGDRVRLEIARIGYPCQRCGADRLRGRMIDLPLLEGAVIFKKIKVFYCPDCGTSMIESKCMGELVDNINRLAKLNDTKTLSTSVVEALESYQKNWATAAEQRKVVSVYFPTRKKTPGRAQIALAASDPLYPVVRSLTSEEIRSILGIQFLEDMEMEAKKQHRTISQFLKLELARRLLDDGSSKAIDLETDHVTREIGPEDNGKSDRAYTDRFEIVPRREADDYFEPRLDSMGIKLAAESSEKKEIVLLETEEKQVGGILEYDYSTAELFITVKRNDTGHEVFDLRVVMNDNKSFHVRNSRIVESRILLISKTRYTRKDVSRIVLKTMD